MADADRSSLAQIAIRVHAPGVASDDVQDLTEWIRTHTAATEIEHHHASGHVVVRYDERRAPRRFIEGVLLDRLRMTRKRPAIEPRPLEVAIVHELPGRVRLRVNGTGAGALERMAAFVEGLPGIERARASPAASSLLVHFDPAVTSSSDILARIGESAPQAWPAGAPPTKPPWVEWAKAGFAGTVLAASVTGLVPAPVLLGGALVTAIPPFRRALTNLANGRVNVDVMDAVAITVCVVRSEPITASVITTLLAVGDLILDRTQARARTAISRLMQLDDGEAFLVKEDGRVEKVLPRSLSPGARIVVYPGGRIPVDGVIVEGGLAVDEKALTGESVPRDRLPGDRVLAASVVVEGQAVIEVERAGGDTVAARIVQILEGAGSKPMTLQKNAEKVADRLVLPTFGAAGAAWALSGVVDRLTSVLITDFGTGVRVAVPTAALAAMTLAAREGVLVKGATFLERLTEADTIVFDKTGTLTLGIPHVTDVVALARFGADEMIAYAASAEGNQHHPIADAIRRRATEMGIEPWPTELDSEIYRIGLGLSARVNEREVLVGNARMMRESNVDPNKALVVCDDLARKGASSVLLAIDGVLAGVIGYADAPRPESAEVVRLLKAGGRRRILLLSGDALAPVQAIARSLDIDEAIGEVLPQDKAEIVRKLKTQGRKVAMVGDGINDAPALAVADIGISLQGGTDVALETADVVLLEGGLERLPSLFRVSDEAMARIKQVLSVILVPNAIAIAAGALGLINPITAAIVNNGSTIAAAVHAVRPLLTRSSAARGQK